MPRPPGKDLSAEVQHNRDTYQLHLAQREIHRLNEVVDGLKKRGAADMHEIQRLQSVLHLERHGRQQDRAQFEAIQKAYQQLQAQWQQMHALANAYMDTQGRPVRDCNPILAGLEGRLDVMVGMQKDMQSLLRRFTMDFEQMEYTDQQQSSGCGDACENSGTSGAGSQNSAM